jgi:hypothetical protein
VLPGLVLFGVTIPLAFVTVNALTLEGAATGAEGVAAGVMNTAQWFGGALGAAAASALAGPVAAGPAALDAGVREGFGACAAAGLLACAIALSSVAPSAVRRRARREERARAGGVEQLPAAVEIEA